MASGISAGVAYVDVIPNMKKFGPALAAETTAATSGATGALKTFGKTGALAIGAVTAASVGMAASFEQSMRNVNSLAQLPEPAFDRLNEQVLALAGPTGQAPKVLADAMYDLVSSGFDAQESLKIVKQSAIGATAGMTDAATSTKSVAAVLNAYRLPASDAKEVTDQLFQTVKQGVISFEELSQNIGDTLPFAASLGVGLDELGASTATMTKQGLGASETFTRIRNLMQSLIKPNEDLSAAIEETGFKNGEALIKAKGFQGALEAIVGTTNGTKQEVAKLFPNIRALGGALALTGKNAKDARKDLKGMQDSAGAARDVFEEQSKSLATQWNKLKANLSVLAIRFGNVLIPAITDAVRWLNEDFGQALRDVAAFVTPVARAVGGWLAGAFRDVVRWVKTAIHNVVGFVKAFIPFKILVAVVKRLAPAFNAVKTAARIAFALIKGAARVVWEAIKALWEVVKGLGRIIGDVIGVASHLLRGDFSGAWESIKAVVRDVGSVIKAVVKGAIDIAKAVFRSLKDVAREVFGAIGDFVSALMAPIQALIDKVSDLVGILGDALEKAADLGSKLGQALGGNPGALLRADGGPVTAGDPYIVGEVGPELFVPHASGTIIPNHKLRSNGVEPGAARRGPFAMVITNWQTGEGYIRDLAEASIDEDARFRDQRGRMGKARLPR